MAEKARCQSSIYLFSDYGKKLPNNALKRMLSQYEREQDAAFMAVTLSDSNRHFCMLIFNSQGFDRNVSESNLVENQSEKTVAPP